MRSFFFAAALLAIPALGFAQGALTPPSGAFLGGAPAPTMKSLDQIEARTPLGAVGGSFAAISIDSPGSYVLLGNLSVRAGDGITINSDNVTLDLNGFTISSSANPASGTAVLFPSSRHNIVIRNGHIGGAGAVDPATGGFSGAGFSKGIFSTGTLDNSLVSEITLSGLALYGIYLDSGSTVDRCVVVSCYGIGIVGQAVTNCSATNCGNTSIQGISVSNSYGASVAGTGISATSASNCIGTSTSGIGLIATQSAANCSGSTQSGTYGLRVATAGATPVLGSAESCKGTVASGSGVGLSAGSASNCTGTAVAGCGLEAISTTNCNGISASGTGLSAEIATNCNGKSTTGTCGLNAANTATGCYGEVSAATGGGSSSGLWAYTASNCRGSMNCPEGDASSHYGLAANIAENCYGAGLRSNGLRATFSALNCRGECNAQLYIGLDVTYGTANNCSARSGNGLGGYGVAIKAAIAIAIACSTNSQGTVVAPQKFLGTP